MRTAFASLTSRLVLVTVALVALLSLLIAAGATIALHSYLSSRLDRDVVASLGRLPQGPEGTYAPPDDHDGDNHTFDQPRPGLLSGVLYGPNGSWGQIPDDEGTEEAISRAALVRIAQLPVDRQAHEVNIPGYGEYRVALGSAPFGVTVAGLPTSSVDGPTSQLVLFELLVGGLGIAAAAVAATLVVRRQLRPLREVATTAHTVAGMPLATGEIELAERVPDRLTDERTEVGQVGSALNTLLAHVESSLHARHESEQQVRQFVADASHELRTPLTTIAGYTELARRRPDPITVDTALGKVEEESARMTAMVEDLLLLARLDSGRPLERQPVDLSRLLVEAVSDARVVAPDHKWQIEMPEESIEVTGDAQRLHQVVTNLLANARKYTPAGTIVTVTARPDGFSVRDDGPGFPDGLAEHAFERFARGDASRTRRQEGGVGLGLALVKAIVTAHGGQVSLVSRPGSTEVTVTLPR